MIHPRWAAVLAVVPLLAGCTGEAGGPRLPDVPRWSLADSPGLVIEDDGEPGHDLFQVRGARSLPDGGLLVLNGGSFEVRRFDAGGRLVATIGGPGEGPGEFRMPLALQLIGDTVAVYDLLLSRLSRFDLAGELLNESSFVGEPWAMPGVAMEVVSNGDLLATDLVGGAPIDPATHLRRMPHVVVRHRTAEGATDSLAEGPGAAFLIEASARGERAYAQPFGATTIAAASPTHTFIGASERYSIRVLDRGGTQVAEIDGRRPARAVDEALRTAMIDWRVAVGPTRNAADTRTALEGAELPATVPAFGELVTDDDGLLWVAPYWLPGEPTRTWEVWDAAGVRRATVEVPADLRVVAIHHDAVVAVGSDADGAERVVRLALVRDTATD